MHNIYTYIYNIYIYKYIYIYIYIALSFSLLYSKPIYTKDEDFFTLEAPCAPSTFTLRSSEFCRNNLTEL